MTTKKNPEDKVRRRLISLSLKQDEWLKKSYKGHASTLYGTLLADYIEKETADAKKK